MRYRDFKNLFGKFPIISSSHVYNITKSVQSLRNQLTLWQKKGLILKLRKGLYVLNDEDRKINPSRAFLANQIYSPSYISCEYALGFYDLIPEKVEDVTSVSTKKTSLFKNPFGVFRYQHLKTTLFFGFKKIKDENSYPFLIAEPEKAVLDFIYLKLPEFKDKEWDIFKYSYRFQNISILKKGKLKHMAKEYKNARFKKVVDTFLAFMKKETVR